MKTDTLNYPYWTGRLSGFLKMMKHHKLPDDLQTEIDKLLAEWDKVYDKEKREVFK